MTTKPILFSAPMVRAILGGRKTMTRRVVRWPIQSESDGAKRRLFGERDLPEINQLLTDRRRQTHPCRRLQYRPGLRLWVRETWGLHRPFDLTDWHVESLKDAIELPEGWELDYRADWKSDNEPNYWRPSIYMPRWASRITLEITNVRVERVQDISEKDILNEGVSVALAARETRVPWANMATLHDAFRVLWDKINGRRPGCSWRQNPWVWCLTFKRNEDGPHDHC